MTRKTFFLAKKIQSQYPRDNLNNVTKSPKKYSWNVIYNTTYKLSFHIHLAHMQWDELNGRREIK